MRNYVDQGRPVHVADALGDTLLWVAASTGNVEVVKVSVASLHVWSQAALPLRLSQCDQGPHITCVYLHFRSTTTVYEVGWVRHMIPRGSERATGSLDVHFQSATVCDAVTNGDGDAPRGRSCCPGGVRCARQFGLSTSHSAIAKASRNAARNTAHDSC